jgi:hypothetical protein
MMKNNFTFDPIEHVYRFKGEKVPSVTGIISDLSDFSGIPPWILDNKSRLGTEFHRIIKLHWIDNLRYDTIDKRLVKAFNTFLEWSAPRLDEFRKAISETKLFNEKMWLAGTCDLATPGELFDWKLRNYIPVTDILQLDGYDTLLGGGKRKRWTMCFDMKSGRLSQRRSEHSQAHSMFMYMLDYHHSEEKDKEKHLQLLDSWKGEFN